MAKRAVFFTLATVVALAVALPSVSSAQTMTVAQMQAEIQSLLAQVQSLEQQLAAAQGGSASWCYTFDTNLSIGMSGSAVTALQTALEKDGESTNITGTFDDQTASAVTGFQQKYASQILTPNGLQNGTGYAGKSTQAELNSLFGCSGGNSPVATPPIIANPIFPNPTPTSTLPIMCPAWGCGSPPAIPLTPIQAPQTTSSAIQSASTSVQLSIASVSPSSGPAGTVITISGQGFSSLLNPDPDMLAGVYMIGSSDSAQLYSWYRSPSEIESDNTIVVPIASVGCIGTGLSPSCSSNFMDTLAPGAYSIVVRNTEGTKSNAVNFTLTPSSTAPAVSIASINPSSGPSGTTVTVTGSGFTSHDNAIVFGGNSAGSSDAPDGKTVTFTVPSTLQPKFGTPIPPGPYQVYVQNAYGESNTVTFTVTASSTAAQPPSGPLLTISADANTPSGNIVVGNTAVTLAKYDVTTGNEPVKILFLNFGFMGSAVAGSASALSNTFRNIALYDDAGGQVGTTITSPPSGNDCSSGNSGVTYSSNTGYYIYNDCLGTSASPVNYIVPANTTRVLSLKADLPATANLGFLTSFALTGSNDVQGVSSLQVGSTGNVGSGARITLVSPAAVQ